MKKAEKTTGEMQFILVRMTINSSWLSAIPQLKFLSYIQLAFSVIANSEQVCY